MDELIKLLEKDLEYISHDLTDDIFCIQVRPTKEMAVCPYCGSQSSSAHSCYERSFRDLPIQGKQVVIQMQTRRMFCHNQDCSHTTFAERYSFLSGNAKQTNRLKEHIIDVALETSSVAATEVLGRNAVKTSKSTICLMLKKPLPLWIKDDVTEICVDDLQSVKTTHMGQLWLISKHTV